MISNPRQKYAAVVIGASAGGLNAVLSITENISPAYPLPIIIVQHRSKDSNTILEEVLQHKSKIKIKQADEKEKILPGTVYIAPPDYHLLIEDDLTFSLTSDIETSYSRPSIDVLFESAAEVYKEKLIGIILTGANHDGTEGIKKIKKFKGLTIAQTPGTAPFPTMPQSAINAGGILFTYDLKDIVKFLKSLEN